ncbi:MAG: hypothetical protein JWR53_1993 [Glaciihabitans sp.]|nr:hypothetical protein [Glaciihabitans sp.]
MRVLLTGATGFVGSAVVRRLLEAGHEVTAIVRSQASADAVAAAGGSAVVGDLFDTEFLTSQLASVDAAIHTAAPDDGTDAQMDDAVIDAVQAAFAGSARPFIYTGGIWTWGSGIIDETMPQNAPPITSWRLARQERVLAGGINGTVLVPGIVYGHGLGIPNVVARAPHSESGAVYLVGDGSQHWTTVHVDDLADLYVAAVEQGKGGIFHGVSGVNPTVQELGLAVAPSTEPQSPEATRDRLGAGFADALMLDQQASGKRARETFGWRPRRTTLADELREGYLTDSEMNAATALD